MDRLAYNAPSYGQLPQPFSHHVEHHFLPADPRPRMRPYDPLERRYTPAAVLFNPWVPGARQGYGATDKNEEHPRQWRDPRGNALIRWASYGREFTENFLNDTRFSVSHPMSRLLD